jgi:threonine/homoserine/homoserine lactone efflux protein
MTPDAFLPLVLFALVSTVTPGAATMLATASGAHFGFFRSVPLVAGAAFGLATVAAAAAAGLAGVLLAMPSLQLVLKAGGSVYLLWLAWKIGRSGAPRQQGTRQATAQGAAPGTAFVRPTGFIGAAWLLWYNPKGWAMSMGAAASFAALASGPAQLAILLGLTFGLAAAASLSLWCVTGQMLARWFRTDRQWHILNAVLGLILALTILPMWVDLHGVVGPR